MSEFEAPPRARKLLDLPILAFVAGLVLGAIVFTCVGRRSEAPRPAATPLVSPPASPAPTLSDLERLAARNLALPVLGLDRRQLRDDFSEMRGVRVHQAIDILAARGTPVVAVDDGVVKKLFHSARGGLTVYQFDPSETYCYYYAHLDRYAGDLEEGMRVRKGDRLGDVGSSGNADPGTPHLHFTVFKLGPARRWWEGTPINPFPLWAKGR